MLSAQESHIALNTSCHWLCGDPQECFNGNQEQHFHQPHRPPGQVSKLTSEGTLTDALTSEELPSRTQIPPKRQLPTQPPLLLERIDNSHQQWPGCHTIHLITPQSCPSHADIACLGTSHLCVGRSCCLNTFVILTFLTHRRAKECD